MESRRLTAVAIALAVSAAAIRLVPLGWLHPLNWDELELYRVARWIAEGRVPFRDFWEHHTPVAWYLFAPFTRLTDSPGADAVLLLRWAQIPVWVAVFAMTFALMREAGVSRFARWSAAAIALSSSFFMLPAIETRLDSVACLFYVIGMVCAQRAWRAAAPRMWWLLGGSSFALAGLTNLRLGPLLACTALLLFVADPRVRRWRVNANALWMAAGVFAIVWVALGAWAANGSLAPMIRQVWTENNIGNRYGQPIAHGFVHRLLVPFGVRMIASDRLFELAAVDAGGIALLVFGAIGIVLALRARREPDDLFLVALLQVVNLAVIASMNFIYNYHFEIAVVLMLPLVALAVDRLPRKQLVVAVLALAWCVNVFASVFRGKELDLAYQDFVMREVHRRTAPPQKVWSGMSWALRREPAYWFWFLPDMTRHLVRLGYSRPYAMSDVLRDPPAVVVADHYALVWMAGVQRELGRYFVHHYIPASRNIWIPGLSGVIAPGGSARWIAPADGVYRIYAGAPLARHPWFRAPLSTASYEAADAARLELRLPSPAASPELELRVDGVAVAPAATIALRRGQRVELHSRAAQPLAVILLPGSDTILFRQPPPGATLEGASTRVTHVPNFHVRIE